MAVCIVKSWGRKCWELQGRQRWRETQRERGAEGGRREVGWIKAGSKNHMERQTGEWGRSERKGWQDGRMVGWQYGWMVQRSGKQERPQQKPDSFKL